MWVSTVLNVHQNGRRYASLFFMAPQLRCCQKVSAWVATPCNLQMGCFFCFFGYTPLNPLSHLVTLLILATSKQLFPYLARLLVAHSRYISENFRPLENNSVTVWIALDDADEETGVVTGNHSGTMCCPVINWST